MVLGSSLGGLAAAAYLARSGLRVTLIEEECKRRPTVREPFFLSGLESGGLVLRLLQELALPLIDRRRIERHPIGLQLILPEAWIDIPRGSTAIADELELQGVCPADEARAWLEAVDVQGQKVRARLWDSAYGLVGTSAGRLVPRSEADLVAGTELPLTPSPLIQFVHSQLEALSSSMKEVSGPLPALPLHATHAGGFSLPPAQPGGIRALLRGRFRTLHGEILSASSLELIQERGDVGVALADRKILARAPMSRMVLKYRGMSATSVAGRFTEMFAGHGVDPARLLFRDRSPHAIALREYHLIDIALDPFPFGGGATTCEALWMGVPVITSPGETFASRHSLSYLSNVGLTEMVARDLSHYVDLAVELAHDLPQLAKWRAELRERMARSPLCDGPRFADNLMKILRSIWHEYRRRGRGDRARPEPV